VRIAFLNPQGNFDPQDRYWTEHPDFGGQLVYVKELGLALARLGIDVDIVTRYVDDPDWQGFDGEVDHYDECADRLRIVRVRCGGERFLAKEQLWPVLPEYVANYVKFNRGRLPDAVTSHYADGGYSAVLMQSQTGLPFTFTGHSLGAQKMDKLGMDRDNAEDFERRFHFSQRIAGERLAMRYASTIITSTAQERFEQYGHPLYRGAVDPADDDKFRVIPPGVNNRIFTTEARPDDAALNRELDAVFGASDLPVILVSSRLDEKKNIIGVVRAFAGSGALQARAQLALVVRGVTDPRRDIDRLSPAEQKVLRPIMQVIDVAGVGDKVHFLDLRSQTALAAAYRYLARRGSVFVLTSFYEPFGLAPIEAAAAGLAVVATRNGGPTEIFSDGSGVLVDPNDENDIARGVVKALDEFASLSRRARERVMANYTWDRTAQSYLEVIREMLRTAIRERPGDTAHLDAGQRIREYLDSQSEPALGLP